jgi:hypothetical protein
LKETKREMQNAQYFNQHVIICYITIASSLNQKLLTNVPQFIHSPQGSSTDYTKSKETTMKKKEFFGKGKII